MTKVIGIGNSDITNTKSYAFNLVAVATNGFASKVFDKVFCPFFSFSAPWCSISAATNDWLYRLLEERMQIRSFHFSSARLK